MNILHVTANLREAELVGRRLTSVSSDFHLDTALSVKDAAGRLSDSSSAYEAILLDMNLPGDDADSILTYVRQKGLPLAIIAFTNPEDEEPPMEILKGGADDYVVRRGDYETLLPGILQRTMERRRVEKRPVHLLYAGNVERARHELAAEKWIQLDAAIANSDGSLEDLKGAVSDFRQYGAIILEESYLGVHILRVLRDVITRAPEVPALLLVEPGHEEVGIQGLNLGAAEYIIKSGFHLLSLTTKLRALLAHKELARRMPTLESSEARLRTIVEAVPVSLLMLARNGMVLAMNVSGISLIGAAHAEDIVAKNILDLLPSTQADLLKSYIEHVCQGERTSVRLEWEGLDKKLRLLELSGVPIERGPNGDVGVLSVLTDITQTSQMQQVLTEAQARLEQLQREVVLAEAPVQELDQRIQLEEEHSATTGRELEERAKKAEEQKAHIEEMLRLESQRRSELAEKFANENAQWEAARQEQEQKSREAEIHRAKLDATLQQLNSSKAELAENYSSEKSQWEAARQEQEQKSRDTEAQRAKLEETLQQLNASKAELAEDYSSEKLQWEAARQEQEQKSREAEAQRAKLEEALQELNASKAELAEDYSSEKLQWEAARQELEQKSRAAEAQRTKLEEALQELNSSKAGLAERYSSEKSQWEAARQEQEQKSREAEAQRAKLEEALQQLNSSKAELAENYSSEKSQWEAARQEFELSAKEAENERFRIDEALRAADLRQSEMVALHAREGAHWESVRNELETSLNNMTGMRAELAQALQLSETQKTELIEKYSQVQEQKNSAEGKLEQQIRLTRLLEVRESELVKQQKELTSGMENSRYELEQKLEEFQAKNSSLEAALQMAQEQQNELIKDRDVEREKWDGERAALEQNAKTLKDALQELETAHAEMAASVRFDQHPGKDKDVQGEVEQANVGNAPAESRQSDLARVHRLVDDTENRYQSFVRYQSDSYQKLLSQAMQRAQGDTEEWKRILSAQNAGEREFLELMLHKAESRIQRLEEQFKKEREELEFKLHVEEERRRRLSEFCALGLSVSTTEGRILDCNDTFARIFGYQSAAEIMQEPEDEPFKALAVQELSDGCLLTKGETPRVERCARRRDGQPIWLLENIALIPREGEESSVVERGVIDVTERQDLFAEIRRARRIETIVKLSAAAVREFNALLDSMMETSNIALLALDEHDPRRARTEQIREMANRAGNLAQELSAVMQKQETEPETLKIGEMISEMTSMLRMLAGDDVEMVVKPGIDIGEVVIERSRFEQALTTMFVAARDSLPAGGTVSIELSQGPVDRKTVLFPYVLLAVRASGYGALPPQIPSSLNGLVTSSKGYLKTSARPGKEAVYELFIPRM
jgi:PAS domain S-box-containing protein